MYNVELQEDADGALGSPGHWFKGRGKGTKQNVETGEEGSTILHGARSPNMSWQRIYAKGCRPRELFSGNQAGKGTAQSAPTLTGRGNSPEEQRRNVLVATASASAAQALQAADDANNNNEDPEAVAQAVQAASSAIDYVSAVQAMADGGVLPAQAGKGSGRNRTSAAQMRKGKPISREEIQEHYAAKGEKGTGKQALVPYADSLDEDGGETAEEEASENDMEVIPEEDEGNDDGGGDDGGAEGPATTNSPAATASTEVTITSTTAGDPVNVGEEVNAAPENVGEEVNVEQDTEVENARPPRLMRSDPEHEMAPRIPGSLGEQMRQTTGLGTAPATSAQHVQQVMTALMQGQTTIPLTYGRWVQWDQTSWVGSMQTYRYGVLNGLQVEMDFAQVGLMLRRPVVPGVTHSLALQGNVMAVPKSGLTRESTEEEEADPGVPFEHGMVQPGRKPPPQAWFQRQNMQNWMDRMAKPPAKPPAGPPQHAMPGPPPAGPPPHAMPGPPPMGPPPVQAMPRAAQTYVPGPPQVQPPIAAPMQQRPQGCTGYGGDQGGSLRPPQQQMMEEPGQRATLSHMLRMTGELRAEQGVQPAKAAANLGLRSVLRPPMTTSKAAASSTNVYVERREESLDRVTVRSDSPAQSVTSSSTA